MPKRASKEILENTEPNVSSTASSTSRPPATKLPKHCVTFSGIAPEPPRIIGYRRTGTGIDIALRVQGKAFQAHASVLAKHCELFAKIVKSGSYSASKPIELPAVPSAACFDLLLEYLYTGEVHVPEREVLNFLETVHHVKCKPALGSAVAVVRKKLTSSNCLEMLALASRLSLADLHQAAEALVAPNFEQVRRHPAFGTLKLESVVGLLADDALSVPSEESAFEAACDWVDAQLKRPAGPPPTQQQQQQLKKGDASSSSSAAVAAPPPPPAEAVTPEMVASLLEQIRFPTMPRQYLLRHVLPHPIMARLPDGRARELVLRAFLDAHYGPATSKRCTRRFSVPPLPSERRASGSFAVGAPPPASGGAASPNGRRRSRSRSPTKGKRKSLGGNRTQQPAGGASASVPPELS